MLAALRDDRLEGRLAAPGDECRVTLGLAAKAAGEPVECRVETEGDVRAARGLGGVKALKQHGARRPVIGRTNASPPSREMVGPNIDPKIRIRRKRAERHTEPV